MALPNYYAKIKASGIYRFTFDKSEIGGQQAETLRLVVGYSEKGPFNVPTYIESAADFIKIYGNINKKLERRGVWFHRMALQALEAGPILALNLKKFNNESVMGVGFDTLENSMYDANGNLKIKTLSVEDVYDITRFWELSPEKLAKSTALKNKYITFAATDSSEASNTIFVRGYKPNGYDVTLKDYFKTVLNDAELPSWAEGFENTLVSDYFAQIFIFKGQFTAALAKSTTLSQYFNVDDDAVVTIKPWMINAFGEQVDTLEAMALDSNTNFIQSYVGVLLPDMEDNNGAPLSIDLLFNQDNATHKMMMHLDSTSLYLEDMTIEQLNTTGFNRLEFDENGGFKPIDLLSNFRVTPAIVNASFIEQLNENNSIDWTYVDEREYFDEPNAYRYDLPAQSVFEGNVVDIVNTDTTYDATAISVIGFTPGERFMGERGVATLTDIRYEYSPIETSRYVTKTDYYNADAEYQCEIEYITDVKGLKRNVDYFDVEEDSSSMSSTTIYARYKLFDAIATRATLIFDKNIANTNTLIKLNRSMSVTPTNMQGIYLRGYEFENKQPKGSADLDKLNWQNEILSALSYYTGLRSALTDGTSVDYRYIVDTFESYVDSECKSKLSVIAKEKENAVAFCNFPSIETLINCKYTSFTDADGKFNMKYVERGGNRQKPYAKLFSLPSELNGASFASFNTCLAFSDGYQKMTIPSAALVSNKFMEKYQGRQPYYIVAGPNYGRIQAANLVGPDYSFSRADLEVLEPMGVNPMVYVPRQGTYINSNQTAKQSPITALSRLNVRELVIYLQDEIQQLLQNYQWEFNTQILRDTVKAKADYICEQVKANGGLYEYLNVCDESNNNEDIINNEMFIIETSIEPGMGAGKMIQTLTIYKKGGMSALIS